ncbi:MAG: hypothetical protein NTW29_16605 [Bacteroidetes bacterium]|nr:hypothetical protein [Bacteroidota bacterium]
MNAALQKIFINGPDGSQETVFGERVADDTFRLIENPLFNRRINYGTIIKTVIDDKGQYIFSKIVRPSAFNTRIFLLSHDFNEHGMKSKIGKPILEAGGFWEVAMGGFLFIHLLKSSAFNLESLFQEHQFHPAELVD